MNPTDGANEAAEQTVFQDSIIEDLTGQIEVLKRQVLVETTITATLREVIRDVARNSY